MNTSIAWTDIVSALAAIMAAIFAGWAAFEAKRSAESSASALSITAKDSEFLVCLELKKTADALWTEYVKLKTENPKSADEKYLEILSHTEWCCIYIETRGIHTTTPVKHFEDEIVIPIMKQLQKVDGTAKTIAAIIISNMSSDLTFKSLRNRLKANGLDFDSLFLNT